MLNGYLPIENTRQTIVLQFLVSYRLFLNFYPYLLEPR